MYKKLIALSVCLLASAPLLHTRSAGPPPNVNGLTGQYCTQCHRTNVLNSGTGSVRIEGLPAAWVPGEVYPLRVVVSHDTAIRWGFQLSATSTNGNQAGDLLPASDGRTFVMLMDINGSPIQFIEHNSLGSTLGSPNTFEFNYRAPSDAGIGTIRFHVAGNATNGNGNNNGDFVYSNVAEVPSAVAAAITDRTFTISDRATMSISTVGGSGTVTAGHARVQPVSGASIPAAAAILSLRQNNTTVSESAFEAAAPIRSGRIYAEIGAKVNTGLAILNPNNAPATVSFYFTDDSGANIPGGSITLAPNTQMAGFLDQAPFYTPNPFIAAASRATTFTFTSSVPISVMALRGSTNERSEFLITPLQVIDLSGTSTETVTIAHMADGNGWLTEVLLVNPTDETLSGTMQFVSSSGQALSVTIAGQSGSQFDYSLPPRSSRRYPTAGTGDATRTGSIRVGPSSGSRAPSASAVLSSRAVGVNVTQLTVPGSRSGSAFRMYAEASGNFAGRAAGSIQSGFGIANQGTTATTVNLELNTTDGSSTVWTGAVVVPAQGQIAVFLNQIAGSALPASFRGVLRISVSGSSKVSVTAFRGRYNERNTPELIVTTMPAVDETATAPAGEITFPRIVDSGGYTTQLIMFNGTSGQGSAGTVRFYSPSGQAMTLPVR